MKSPLVSIIIPAYNAEKNIHECLDSVIAQTYWNWEAIVILAPSTDKTMDILREYYFKEARIKIIREKTKSTCATARNIGYEKSKGEYIKFLDSDDWLEPDCLTQMIFTLQSNPFLLWCVSYEKTHDQSITHTMGDFIITQIPGTHVGIGGIGGILFRRKCLEFVKQKWGYLFLPSMGHTDDGDLTLRLKPYPVTVIPKVLSHYRWHDNNLTNNTDPIDQSWGLTCMCWRNKRYEFLWYHFKNTLIHCGNALTGVDLVKEKKRLFG
jgi:glycosyltransferase involved in cell wall biosynthesis